MLRLVPTSSRHLCLPAASTCWHVSILSCHILCASHIRVGRRGCQWGAAAASLVLLSVLTSLNFRYPSLHASPHPSRPPATWNCRRLDGAYGSVWLYCHFLLSYTVSLDMFGSFNAHVNVSADSQIRFMIVLCSSITNHNLRAEWSYWSWWGFGTRIYVRYLKTWCLKIIKTSTHIESHV